MPHDARHFAFIIAAFSVISPLPVAAAEAPAPMSVAEAPPPPPQNAVEENKNEAKSGKKEKTHQQKVEPIKEPSNQPAVVPQDGGKKHKDKQQDRQQERARQQEKLQQDRAQRQQDMQRSLQERQQQQKVRQEQLQEQQRQKKALQVQKQQQLEAERTKKQQENERLREERAQQDKLLQEQQRQQRDADQVKKQQEFDRARQESEQQKVGRDLKTPPTGKPLDLDQTQAPKTNDARTYDQVPVQDGNNNKSRKFDPSTAFRPPADAQRVDPNVIGTGTALTKGEQRKKKSKEIQESYRKAPPPQLSFDELKRDRRERSIANGKLRIIEEPDRRIIVKQDNRTFIRHDESERFRRIAPDARTIRRADGSSTTFMTRRGGIRIYDVTDRNGRLLYRYRRYPDGREVVLIDNRRYYQRERNRSRDVLIGAGIGLIVGSAIALSAPEIRIPRDRYIVDYGRASDDDLYEALTAPPIERLDRGYSLEEIRYSAPLRDRMRRIDLDTVTFDFGSWEVGPDQGRALDRLAEGINRVLADNPDEIFMIEGHTDAVGSEEDNLTLSDRRAQSVAEILTTDYGVAPENLVTQGYGEEQLKIPTDGPERANRRITVRRIGPLLSGRVDDDRYSGGSRDDDRTYNQDRVHDGGR
jgi:outer membrane protein OmpA-like peptidoglycan-associated protein